MVNWEYKRDKNNPELLDEKSAEDVMIAEQFECLVKWPLSWKDNARLLLISGEIIFKAYNDAHKRDLERFLAEPWGQNEAISHDLEGDELEDALLSRLLPISLLLKGYAVEDLLKGIIYSRNPDGLKENDENLYLDGKITNHNLDEYYVAAGMAKNKDAIDPETKEILSILEQCIRWQGRYPVPRNTEQLRQTKKIPDSLRRDSEKINGLCVRLFTILNGIPCLPTRRGIKKD
jgi:hypothetical protein